MNIDKIAEGNELIIKLEGRLDTNTAPVLEKELKDDLIDVNLLVLNFKDLKYISSAGLRLILSTQKIMDKQGSMVIKDANEFVMEVFEATGFIDILTME
ncbi:STAS domain-containing protein [Methanobacterium alcaliphilum]|uniref:STAS domain-containing protein n=1 Tax=Methanobacterium alcaliphilum TaxID=392018 RepID=UPI002009E90D|nr:STAS domain-containing protein [Methanobacterium alcaliphilum]MCK9150621.1 STAS domain-containing protein [Methanobacterium alcaliphilum]